MRNFYTILQRLKYLLNVNPSKNTFMRSLVRITQVIMLVVLSFFTTNCKKDEPVKLATVSTLPVTNVAATTATGGGSISSNGGAKILANGVCWSTSPNPTTSLSTMTSDGTGTETFTSSLTSLTANTTYYVRAYATNSAGTSYGTQVSFVTDPINVSDNDGNVYTVIRIGTQVWMKENLKTTKYRNGDLIETTTPATLDILSEVTPKYQWAYDGDESNIAIYGRLYTWYAATDSRNICPTGWHLPTYPEWETLIASASPENWNAAGDKLKEAGTTHWLGPNAGATNESGFTALPGGSRYSDRFNEIGYNGYWWTTLEGYSMDAATSIGMGYDMSNLLGYYSSKLTGNSVRCLKDN
jgi:uncharacterized protein (TIGR02145 family)